MDSKLNNNIKISSNRSFGIVFFIVFLFIAQKVKWKINFDMSFIKELFDFLKVRKKYWLLPIIIILFIFGGLVVLTQGSVVAPFIYTLF